MASFQKYFVSGIAGILVIVLIVGTAISLNNKSGFADAAADPNSRPTISTSEFAIFGYIALALLVLTVMVVAALWLNPRV